MKKDLRLTLFFVFFIGTVSNAQIIYTDIIPDETYTLDQQYMLDVDNDGTDDYIIEQADSTVGGYPLEGVQLRTIGTVNEAIYETTTLTMLKGLALGDPIDLNQSWMVASPSLPAGGVITIGTNEIPAGDWSDGLDHYAGLHFTQSGNNYYGWVRFSVTVDGLSFTVKDYAYHMGKDHALLAGSTVDNVNEINADRFTFSAMANFVSISGLAKAYSIEIIDLSGRVISTENASGLYTKDYSFLESGLYLMRCSNETASAVFKFRIAK